MAEEQFLKERVALACEQAEWSEHRSWPKLLQVLCATFSEEYLVQHEGAVQKYVNDSARYHGNYDFSAHFQSELQPVSGGKDSRITQAKSSSSSRTLNGDNKHGSRIEDDLAGLSHSPLISIPNVPSISEMMQYEPAVDAFSQRKIFKEAEECPWRAVSAWSPTKKSHVPLICREGYTEYSWISQLAAQKLEDEIKVDPDKQAPPEVVGKCTFESEGLVQVRYQPYNCVRQIKTTFNLHCDPRAPDMLIGRDSMIKVRKLRQEGWSYDNQPDIHALHVPPEPRLLVGIRRRRGDSSYGSQASHGQGNDRAPSGESQAGDLNGIGNAETSTNIFDAAPVVFNPQILATRPQLPLASEQEMLDSSNNHVASASKSGSSSALQPSTTLPPVLSKLKIALNIAFFVLVIALALDPVYFVIAKIRNPSQEVSLGSGISLLVKTCQGLLPSLEITSLGVAVEMAAVIFLIIWWYKTDMNFVRRLAY